MKPKRIILIRHAQSEGNADHTVYSQIPDHDIKLTKLGEHEALAAGAEIADIIGEEKIYAYVSPFKRTRQTFEGIAKRIEPNVTEVLEDPRIREQGFGNLVSVDAAGFLLEKRAEYGKFYYRPPNGESSADVYDRISTFMESMYRAFDRPDFPPNVLIVTHGGALRVFLMRWFRLKVEEYLALGHADNCQILTIEMNKRGKYELIHGLD